MSPSPALVLNLASRPARNRRFYLLARNVLAVVLVALVGLTAFTVVKYGRLASRVGASLAEARRAQASAEQEKKRLTAEVRKVQKSGQAPVDTVNRIIYQKSFSWTGFLTELESALPDSITITSLVPSFSGERTVALKLTAVSRGLDDLLVFLNNLNARRFKYRLENETREEEGQLVTEISLTYERDL
jgi:Tfp pilus assembly protein PilN